MAYVRKPRAVKGGETPVETAGYAGEVSDESRGFDGDEERSGKVVIRARPSRAFSQDGGDTGETGGAAGGLGGGENRPVPGNLPRLPSMPDLYGKPEPRNDDGGKPRLSINELTRFNMVDLRELAGGYSITHEDMVTLKKQEIIFAILKAHTERGGIIYAYGSLEILPDGYGFLRSP